MVSEFPLCSLLKFGVYRCPSLSRFCFSFQKCSVNSKSVFCPYLTTSTDLYKKKCTPKSLQGNLDFLLNIQVLHVYTWKGHTMIFTSVSLLLHFCFCYCHPFYVTFKMICFVMKRMMQTDECLLQK